MIKVNFEKAEEIKNIGKYVAGAKSHIADLLAGKIDMTGWVDHPIKYDKEEFSRIKEVANEIKSEAEVLVSIGIGGSYLGAKAAIEYLSDYYSHRTVGADTNNVGADIIRPNGNTVGANSNTVGADINNVGADIIRPNGNTVGANGNTVGANINNVGADIIRTNGNTVGANGNTVGADSNTVGADIIRPNGVEVIFVGNGLSEKYLKETLDYVEGKNFYVNVISKSGGTLEPAVAFDKFKALVEKKYGHDALKKRIIATTDKAKGILKEEADREGYRTFVVPDDIGGRYSVLSAVGLLPIASAGFDIDKLMKGAEEARSIYTLLDENKNDAMKYAIIRNLYYENGKDIEVFATLSPNMQYFAEWLKQLFGESECKGNKGIFPASLNMTADLHSMGQLMQDGKRNIFETFIMIENDYDETRVKYNDKFFVNDLNDIALRATEKAHHTGNVPVIEIKVAEQNETTLGELFYFFEMSCAISALILGVNPFNQPGVEEYKKNIKELLK